MAQLIELFVEGWRVPDGDYGNLIFQNSHILIYSNRGDGVITTTAFSLDSDNRLVKKTMSSKTVRITEQSEEVIDLPDEYYGFPKAGQEYFELCLLFLMTVDALKKLVMFNKGTLIKRADALLDEVNSSSEKRQVILNQIESLENSTFAMQ